MHAPFKSLVFALASLTASLAWAQTPNPDPNLERTVDFKWCGVFFGDNQPELYIKTNGQPEKLDIPPFQLSAVVRYRGKNPMVIYTKRKGESPGKPDELEPIGSYLLDADWSQVLLFFYPKGAGQIGVSPVKDDPTVYKQGKLRIINVTTADLGLSVNEDLSQIKSGEIKYFDLPAAKKQVPVRYAIIDADKWRWKGSNIFSLPPQARVTVVIAKTDANTFKAVDEFGERYANGELQVFSFEQTDEPQPKNN
ncbi:MAG: hypothetical protein NTU80_03350 [Verrucomicrobia bacterium]|nr:hypothetical protein [Verrucomicrobiota bacterium]